MPESNREVVAVTERVKITEQELEDAFRLCENEFWAKAVELFPEAQSGDTEPGATSFYGEVVKAFMKHWLDLNTRIKVGGLTEEDAIGQLEEIAQYASETQDVTGTPETEITIKDRDQTVTLEVVSLIYGKADQGYGIEAVNPVTGDREIGTREDDLEGFMNLVFNGKDEPDE